MQDLRTHRVFTGLALFCSLCLATGCSPTVQIFPTDDPASTQSPLVALEGLEEDSELAVVLTDGSRFDAKYRGISVSSPCFADLRWSESPPERDLSARNGVWMFSDDEIQKVFRYRSSKGDMLLMGASLAALVFLLSVYSHGQGE